MIYVSVKDCFKKDIVIHCDTEEKAIALCKYAEENGFDNNHRYSLNRVCWNVKREETCYHYTKEFNQFGGLEFSDIKSYELYDYQVVSFDALLEFKQNDEEDVFNSKHTSNLFSQGVVVLNHLGNNRYGFKKQEMLIVNNKKKYVSYKLNNKEYKVECHQNDKFNWFTGFGLALSQCYGNKDKWKDAREYFRNPKTRKLDYKNYAQWCIFEYFKNDMIEVKNLQNRVKEINEYGKVDL